MVQLCYSLVSGQLEVRGSGATRLELCSEAALLPHLRVELIVLVGPAMPLHSVMDRSAPPTNRDWTLVCNGRRDWKCSTSVMLIPLHMETSKDFSCRQSCPTAFRVLQEETVVVIAFPQVVLSLYWF